MAAMSFTRSAASSFLRMRAVAGLASGLGVLLAGVLFLSALFSHSRVLGMAALVALAVSLLSVAVIEGWRAHRLLETERWMTFGGRPTSRSEQPAKFVTWVTLHGLLATAYGAAAAFMIWIAFFSGH
jgi:hypothetical protein